MHLRTTNRGQHPGIVDDWENPDDMEPIGQKILKWAQKKQEQVQVQEQRDKEKVNIADIEDKLHHENVQRASTANHPALSHRKKSIGSSKKSLRGQSSAAIACETYSYPACNSQQC